MMYLEVLDGEGVNGKVLDHILNLLFFNAQSAIIALVAEGLQQVFIP